MATIPSAWELASLLCKLLLYFGGASVIGGSLCLWQFSDGRRQSLQTHFNYIMFGSLLGFQAVLLSFLIQVGQISGAGLRGMFDWGMASILLDTSLGDVTFLRMLAFVWTLLATLLYLRKLKLSTQPFPRQFYRRLVVVYLPAFAAIAFSFRLAGHASVLTVSAQFAIVLHFTAFALWIGSLYPLLQLTRTTDLSLLLQLMKRFGNFAMAVVLTLVIAGVIMLLQVIHSPRELVSNPYGIALLLKFLLALLLLAVAGLNKLYLVPRIFEATGAANLSKSIRMEIVVATLLLCTTAYLSTIVGPVEN